MMAVGVDTNSELTTGAPRLLFHNRLLSRAYDVTADGARFLTVQGDQEKEPSQAEIVYVPNWFEELRTRVR